MSKRFWFTVFLVAGIIAGPAMAQSLVPMDPATVTNGHVYLMDNVSANVPDDSANSNNGNLIGSPQSVPGLNGGALKLNGSSDGVHLPDAATINTSIHQNKTVIAAFNCADVSRTDQQVVYEEGGSTRGLVIYVHQGLVYAGGWNRGDYTPQWNPGTWLSAPIGSNEWHVVTAVLRGGGAAQEDDKFEMWMDGERIARGPGGEFRSRSDDNGVGTVQAQTRSHDGSVLNAGYWFGGMIDELWILNSALTEDELGALTIGPRPFASGPDPRKDSLLEATTALLSWRPGDFAVSHALYLGTSAEEVETATPESGAFRGNLAAPQFLATDLTAGQTYYWRVDEINEAEPNSPWKGEIWSFSVRPLTAWNPTPADGVPYVGLDQDLSWDVGIGVLFHKIFIGQSFDEVNNAADTMWMAVEPTFDPGALELARTYYWRVDEFTGITTNRGEVWSFTTVPDVAVGDPSLMVWWTLDEGEGMTAVDWSGHGHHGQVIGDARWVDGYQGTTLTFDDRVYVEASNYAGVTGTNPRTLCAWIRTTATGDHNIMSWGENVAGQKWRMRIDSTGGLRLEVNGGYNYGVQNLVDGQWHHVAVTFEDDGTPSALDTLLYVDGQAEASAASQDQAIDTATTGVFRIGESPWHAQPFDGLIDDVRVYDKVLTEEEIRVVMRGNPLLAGDPTPARDALVDIRDISSLRWSAGDGAASHDVYFGTDRGALELKGNQKGTSFSLAGLVAFGGGDYFWRIDEVKSDGTVQTGDVWRFTIPDFLIVDDFESYTDDEGGRIYETWIDGWTNNTGSQVGNLQAPFAERTIVNSGGQSMPLTYDNSAAPGTSEADCTFSPAQNWTAEGVTTLVVHFRGASGNTGQLYVKINGTKVPYTGDATNIASVRWTPWPIDLAAAGVNAASVKTLTIGVEGGSGVLYVDDIRLTKP